MPDPLDDLARTRLSFAADGGRPERIAACKAFLKEAMADLRTRHDHGLSGLEVEHGRSAIIDAWK